MRTLWTTHAVTFAYSNIRAGCNRLACPGGSAGSVRDQRSGHRPAGGHLRRHEGARFTGRRRRCGNVAGALFARRRISAPWPLSAPLQRHTARRTTRRVVASYAHFGITASCAGCQEMCAHDLQQTRQQARNSTRVSYTNCNHTQILTPLSFGYSISQ